MDIAPDVYKIIFLLIVLVFCAVFVPPCSEPFEEVKIKLEPNPLNLNLAGTVGGGCAQTYPDVIVPVYAPWRTYWPASQVYPYYPFYPYYYNNYWWN